MFQSPSLRGSGRFRSRWIGRGGPRPVSIPFIAGQWSLRPRRQGGGGEEHVSIPFIAGQWSLPMPTDFKTVEKFCFNPLHCGAVVASVRGCTWAFLIIALFQSPSLRGSGRFNRFTGAYHHPLQCFNPLHCGAVVASNFLWVTGVAFRDTFQSPSLRGSGRFVIPGSSKVVYHEGFNPLHCGAVVASCGRGVAWRGAD